MQGISQTELATTLSISRNKIASYESGVVEPKISTLMKICEYFQIAPSIMLDQLISDMNTEVSLESDNKESISNGMNDFIKQTNEMTKVLDGYKTFFDLQKGKEEYHRNANLYGSLHDMLKILESLIQSNWKLIQSIHPHVGEEE
jgi:transcriptional regulator with XRE-family HTH domain